MADALVDKPRSLSRETCLNVVRKHLFQATSNWLYVGTCRIAGKVYSAGLFCVRILYRRNFGTAVGDFFMYMFMHKKHEHARQTTANKAASQIV